MKMTEQQLKIKELIRNIPDFPKPGIMFRDITSLLNNADGIDLVLRELIQTLDSNKYNKIVAIESRGFIIGTFITSIFQDLSLVLARKPGKLPTQTLQKKFNLEYGDDALCIQTCDISDQDNILVVDDVLATGGTAKTTVDIIEALGGHVKGCYFLIELDDLGGRKLLAEKDIQIISSVHY